MLQLPDLQRRFFGAITRSHGDGSSTGALTVEIREHGPLTAHERVEIYARMYCARLIDALAEDYPQVAAILGPDEFAAAAHRYVEEHPSTNPSLRWFGRGFGEFLAARTAVGHPGFIPDLARLEWARLDAFDAADVELLRVDDLRRVAPDDWPTLLFAAVPALDVVHSPWPLHRIWEDRGAHLEWRPEETWLRVWRQGDHVFQSPMDSVERRALEHVLQGDDFSTLCAGVADFVRDADAPRVAGALVLRWIEDGLLRGPTVMC